VNINKLWDASYRLAEPPHCHHFARYHDQVVQKLPVNLQEAFIFTEFLRL
jgi:hypothetical protein